MWMSLSLETKKYIIHNNEAHDNWMLWTDKIQLNNWMITDKYIIHNNELNVIFVIIYTGIHNDSFVFSSDIQSMNVYIYGGFLK